MFCCSTDLPCSAYSDIITVGSTTTKYVFDSSIGIKTIVSTIVAILDKSTHGTNTRRLEFLEGGGGAQDYAQMR